MDFLKKISNFKINGEFIFLCAFSIYFISNSLAFTMYSYVIPSIVGTAVRGIVCALLLFKFIQFDKFNHKEIFIIGGLLLLSLIVAVTSENKDIFFLTLLVIGAKNVNFVKIMKVYLLLSVSILLLTITSAQVGTIANLKFFRGGDPRFAMGTIYPTNFAAIVFYILVCYCFLKAQKLNIYDYIGMIVITTLVYHITLTRLSALISIFLVFIMFEYQRYSSSKTTLVENEIIKFSWLSMPIFSVLIYWLSSVYNSENKVLELIDHALSGRLGLGNSAIFNYPVTMLGQFIEQNGWGGLSSVKNLSNFSYFFIDSSFLRLLLMYGIIFTVFVIGAFMLKSKQLLKQGNVLIPMLLVVIALSSTFDANLLEISVNPFLWIFFSDLDESYLKVKSDK